MSGPLVGLVKHHGPRDPHEYAVANALAEELHHARDHTTVDLVELGRWTRLRPTSLKSAIKRGRADGWLIVEPGRGRGNASTYRVVFHRWRECSEKCRHATTLVEQALGKAVATRPHSELKGSPEALKWSPGDYTSVSPVNPSVAVDEVDDPLPVVTGVRIGPDEDTIRRALRAFPKQAATASTSLRQAIGDALDRGQTAADIDAELVANVDVTKCANPAAVIVARVRAMPARRPSRPPAPAVEETREYADPVIARDAMATMRAALADVPPLTGPERLAEVGKRPEHAAFPTSQAKPDSKLAAQRAARRRTS